MVGVCRVLELNSPADMLDSDVQLYDNFQRELFYKNVLSGSNKAFQIENAKVCD